MLRSWMLLSAIGFSGSLAIAESPITPLYRPHAAKDPTQLPPPILRAPGAVTFNLVTVEVMAEIAPGKKFWFWTFARSAVPGDKRAENLEEPPSVPGPMIRVKEGDVVTINLTNGLPAVEPHNIDFHAAMGPGGGAVLTNIEPGETKTFTFKAMRPGSYVYHCAGEGFPWEHVAHGMFGLIQVDPPSGLPAVYNGRSYREFYVGQSDWYLTESEVTNPKVIGSFYNLDEEKADEEHPNAFSFNGHTGALASDTLFGQKIQVNLGDPVRIFFVNGGPNVASNFHIIGQIFDKVYPGHPSSVILNEETTVVPPGSATVVEFQALTPGTFVLVDHALFRVPKGAAGYLRVNGTCPTGAPCLLPPNTFRSPINVRPH